MTFSTVYGRIYYKRLRIGEKMAYIFVINGSAESGKDTLCDLVADRYLSYYVNKTSSIDIIKSVARRLGWDGNKDDKSRKFLSDLKFLSSEYNDLPFEYTDKIAKEASDMDILFVHIREPKEITKFISSNPTAKSILVKRKGVNVPLNEADQGVNDYNYDYVVLNYGDLETFKNTICDLFDSIIDETY